MTASKDGDNGRLIGDASTAGQSLQSSSKLNTFNGSSGKLDIEGSHPNWRGSIPAKIHTDISHKQHFEGGFPEYYKNAGNKQRMKPNLRYIPLKDSRGQREPGLHFFDRTTPGIENYFSRCKETQQFRRHLTHVEPLPRKIKPDGRRFLEQPIPPPPRPSRRREFQDPEPSVKALFGDLKSRKACKTAPAAASSMSAILKTYDTNHTDWIAGGWMGFHPRKRTATASPRIGLAGQHSTTRAEDRVEDQDRFFLSYVDSPIFKRFLQTLKPLKRRPIERHHELRMKQDIERKQDIDLVCRLE